MKKMLQIELNEVNFEFVKGYCSEGKLPTLSLLMKTHGLIETTSEQAYDELEPWVQWVSAHTGLSFAEHGVFRLGDILSRPELHQIWEVLEQKCHTVGAIAPMNGQNRCMSPKFFVPDPWTGGRVMGALLLQRLYSALAQLVNDNAQSKVKKSSLVWLSVGLMRYARPVNFIRYGSIIVASIRKRWPRALILDLLLADVFIRENKRSAPDFSSLFLNAAAHIQHHHMFESSMYRGQHRNPPWYRDRSDPILQAYELYDSILEQIMKSFPNHRITIATALSQKPHPEITFYWRLRDHISFIKEIGIIFEKIEPRMSRDFVIFCKNNVDTEMAFNILSSVIVDDGFPLFDVDNRGDSLFVTLCYPNDISPSSGYKSSTKNFQNLRDKCAFVAIKNGAHHDIGYLIDTEESFGSAPIQIPLIKLFERAIKNFEKSNNFINI